MPSTESRVGRLAACGARTETSIPTCRSARARRRMNEPAASPVQRGKACVRKRTRSAAGSAAIALVILALLVQPSLDLAELRALRGDLVAEHAGGEEDAAEKNARLDDRPDPPLADAVDPQPRERQQPGEDAKAEDAEAEHGKEQQRLLTESELEPDGDHVEHADRNPMPGRELRAPRVPWIERHRNFSDF